MDVEDVKRKMAAVFIAQLKKDSYFQNHQHLQA